MPATSWLSPDREGTGTYSFNLGPESVTLRILGKVLGQAGAI